MVSSLKTHHVGLLVADISVAGADQVRKFGYQVKTAVLHDPVQSAYVQFLQIPGDSLFLELVSPDGPQSKLANALKKSPGLNHLCYSTADIEGSARDLRALGMYLLQEPVLAVAFPGRRIAWLIGPDLVPIELVERSPDGAL